MPLPEGMNVNSKYLLCLTMSFSFPRNKTYISDSGHLSDIITPALFTLSCSPHFSS